MPVPDYVELVAPLHDDRYRLVNRRVERGVVAIDKNERYELLRERIRVLLRRDLPHRVPKEVCEQTRSKGCGDQENISGTDAPAVWQSRRGRFSSLHAGAYHRTCGGHQPHACRPFSLTAFLHNIGMNTTGIAEALCPLPGLRCREDHVPGRAYHRARRDGYRIYDPRMRRDADNRPLCPPQCTLRTCQSPAQLLQGKKITDPRRLPVPENKGPQPNGNPDTSQKI